MPYYTEKPARVQAIQFDNNVPDILSEFPVLKSITPFDSKADYAMFKVGGRYTFTVFRGEYVVYDLVEGYFRAVSADDFQAKYQGDKNQTGDLLTEEFVIALEKALQDRFDARAAELKSARETAATVEAPKRRGRPPKAKPAEEAKK